MNPFVSVHMIVKENTHLGEKFLNGAFTSLWESNYPNEVILIDNGSSDFIFEKVYEPWKVKFQDFDCELKVIKSPLTKFCDLRNLCLELTDPNTSFFSWLDSDEVLWPEDLDILKNYIMPEHSTASVIWSYFYHCVINPFQAQTNVTKIRAKVEQNIDDYRCCKDNIFSYKKDMKWVGSVHEKLRGLNTGNAVQSQVEYMHYGYCRPQYKTFLKWLKYALLEFGHVGVYKDELIEWEVDGVKKSKMRDYLRDWRDPFNILYDRQEICRPIPETKIGMRDYFPAGHNVIVGDCKNGEDWEKHIMSIDDHSFAEKWRDKYKEMGSWKNTLDWVVEEGEKCGWSIAW